MIGNFLGNKAPRTITTIIYLQLLGMIMLALNTAMTSPIAILLCFGSGATLYGLSLILWLWRIFKAEKRAFEAVDLEYLEKQGK